MVIDIAAGLLALGAAYFGYVTGAWFQLTRMLVMLASIALAYVVGAEMALFHLSTSPELSARQAVTNWFVISFLILWGIGTFATNRFAGDARDASIDRTLGDALGGALVGSLRGALLAYLLVTAMYARYIETEQFALPYAESHFAKVSVAKSLIERKTKSVAEFLDEYYTTEPETPEERIKLIGNLPEDERSVY